MLSLMTRKDKKPAERSLQSILDAWSSSVPNVSIQPMVHGSEPIGQKYPTSGFSFSFSLSVGFPPTIPDLIEAQQHQAVRALTGALDTALESTLLAAGYTNLRPYWDEDGTHFSFARHFPIFGDEDENEEQRHCFRPVQPSDPTYGSPFSDEQFVEIRYAGINMWRVVELLVS